MKRLLLFICILLLVFPVVAQNTLTVHQKDGQQFSYGFEDKPVVTFTDNALVIKSTKVEVQYEIGTGCQIHFR